MWTKKDHVRNALVASQRPATTEQVYDTLNYRMITIQEVATILSREKWAILVKRTRESDGSGKTKQISYWEFDRNRA